MDITPEILKPPPFITHELTQEQINDGWRKSVKAVGPIVQLNYLKPDGNGSFVLSNPAPGVPAQQDSLEKVVLVSWLEDGKSENPTPNMPAWRSWTNDGSLRLAINCTGGEVRSWVRFLDDGRMQPQIPEVGSVWIRAEREYSVLEVSNEMVTVKAENIIRIPLTLMMNPTDPFDIRNFRMID